MPVFPYTRMRRVRAHDFTRRLVRETLVTVDDLILPVFICEGANQRQPVKALPGIYRLSIDELIKQARYWLDLCIPAVILFPYLDFEAKSLDAKEAYNPNGLVQRAISALKQAAPQLGVITDIALDPYTIHGQDGIINDAGYVLNDETNQILVKQALSHAQAGADIVGPSDMMDGRVSEIRQAFEQAGFFNKQILSYAAKYSSCYYGPFREAVGASKALGKSNKMTYQLDPGNRLEALREVQLDIEEGADLLMIKPGILSLDIIREVKDTFGMPTVAYQVSGEYAMIKAAAQNGYLDEKCAVLEAMQAFKRAGSDAVVTYYAQDIAKWLLEGDC